jgi:hypothetical protein
LIETALVFAMRRDEWLTHADVINVIGNDYAESTISKAIRELSYPIESLSGLSYIDLETIPSNSKGRPRIRGKLSKAAHERLFKLVSPVEHHTRSHFIGLDKIGRVEIPSLVLEKILDKKRFQRMMLSPEDVHKCVEEKIGVRESNRLLKELINDGQASEVPVSRTHRWGRTPLHQFKISRTALEAYAADTNPKCYKMDAIFRPTTDKDLEILDAAGIVHCPSCGNPIHKSDIIHIDGGKSAICLTEYMHAALNATIRERPDGELCRETVEDIPELTATGYAWDQCRKNLATVIRDWIRNRQKEGRDLPSPRGYK